MIEGSIKLHRNRIIGVSIFFFLISIVSHQLDSFTIYRAIRGIVVLSCLLGLIIFFRKHLKWWMFLFLFLYGLSSLLTIWYENNLLAIIALGLNLIAILILIAGIVPQVDFRKMNWLFISVFVILILFCTYLLYEFVFMLKDYALSDFHFILMLLGAMSLAIAGFFTLLYNHLHSNKVTLLFTGFVFFIIFAEIFRAIGYYDFAYGDIAVYLARALLIGAMVLAYRHVSLLKVESLHSSSSNSRS